MSPFWEIINLNLKALELFKNETVKHPSASVIPDNQLLVKLGNISEFLILIDSRPLILPLVILLL